MESLIDGNLWVCVFVHHLNDNVAYDELSSVSGLAAFFGQKTGQA